MISKMIALRFTFIYTYSWLALIAILYNMLLTMIVLVIGASVLAKDFLIEIKQEEDSLGKIIKT